MTAPEQGKRRRRRGGKGKGRGNAAPFTAERGPHYDPAQHEAINTPGLAALFADWLETDPGCLARDGVTSVLVDMHRINAADDQVGRFVWLRCDIDNPHLSLSDQLALTGKLAEVVSLFAAYHGITLSLSHSGGQWFANAVWSTPSGILNGRGAEMALGPALLAAYLDVRRKGGRK